MNAAQPSAQPKLTLAEALLKAREQLDRIEKRIVDKALMWLHENDRSVGFTVGAVAEGIGFSVPDELRHLLNQVASATVPIEEDGKLVGHFICSYDADHDTWRYYEVPGDLKAAMKALEAPHE